MPTSGNGDDGGSSKPLDSIVHGDHLAHPASADDEDVLHLSSSLADDGESAEPLNDDKGRSSHQVLPASAVECQVVVTGGDGDGDQVLLLVPVSSTPVVLQRP